MNRLKNLTQNGFSHHLLIPILVVAMIAAIGTYVLTHSKAAPQYTLHKGNFGIAPGAGFYLNTDVLAPALDDFQNLGVKTIRSVIPWKNFQPDGPTTFNWKSVDKFKATVNDPKYAGKFSYIITIESPPDWAKAASNIAPISCPEQADFDLQSYANAAAALANRLKGTASIFEIQNSPNIGQKLESRPTAWINPNPCGYTQLLKKTYPAIHAVQPNATVITGGIGVTKTVAGDRIAGDEFLAELYKNGAKGYFDGVGWHPYSTPELPCAPTDNICTFKPGDSPTDPYDMNNGWDHMLNARNIMLYVGDGNKKIWPTEYGAATNGPAGALWVVTEAKQVQIMVAGFQRASQHDWLAPLCWFTYKDDGVYASLSGAGGWMGLLKNDSTRKPSYGAYKYLTTFAAP